jgi:hypothetical protein
MNFSIRCKNYFLSLSVSQNFKIPKMSFEKRKFERKSQINHQKSTNISCYDKSCDISVVRPYSTLSINCMVVQLFLKKWRYFELKEKKKLLKFLTFSRIFQDVKKILVGQIRWCFFVNLKNKIASKNHSFMNFWEKHNSSIKKT